jgi:hypothetical protein
MAKANPVNPADKAPSEPAKADERLMPPAPPLEVKKTSRLPSGTAADPKDLEALVAEAEAEGKRAVVVGNAVRVDH